MSKLSRHTTYHEDDPIRGFRESQLVHPAFVAFLCSAGLDISDLEVTKVTQSPDRNTVKSYITGLVSTLVEIETAGIEDESTREDTQKRTMGLVDNAFEILKDSPTRAVVLDVPYTDIHGKRKLLIAAATMGKDDTVRVGLHTDLATSYSQ